MFHGKIRTITTHQTSPVNEALTLEADEPGHGGASHLYMVSLEDAALCHIQFQNGPIKEVGVNGITHEVLLAILIDRLEAFQRGPYACDGNEHALVACKQALDALKERTRERQARGVEGTHAI